MDSETGEIISLSDDEYKELVFKAPYDHFVDTLKSKKFEDSILFSYQVDSKYNRKNFQMQQFTQQEKRN